MINTYNETHLHKTLKYLYSTQDDSLEMPIQGAICDIYTKEKHIIEIQTGNIYALRAKLKAILPLYPVTIVYTIIENNYILTLNTDGSFSQFRKSPKHGTRFQLFKEAACLIPFFESGRLTLRVLYIDCQTIKIDGQKGRRKNKRTHTIEKILLRINKEECYTNNTALAGIIYHKLPLTFISKDLQQFKTRKYTSYIISFLKRLKKIIPIGKNGKYIVYKKTDA